MDTKGWGETLNSMGWGTQIKDFVAAALKRRNRQEKIMSRNEQSLNTVFSDREPVYSASYNRMKSYMYEHETIVLTSDKDKRTSDQNYEIEQDFRNQLMNLCSDNGWKVIPVYGGYTGTDDRSSNEHSYMIINMNDSKDFRRKVNEFMRNFDKQFKRDFRQECIIYSPALKDDSVKDGNNRHRFNGKAQFDYPNNRRAKSDNVGMFEDKAKSVYRDDDKIGGYFYTTPRRRNSHSYAFGTEFVDDDKVKKER